jgi:hypothetical protein
VRQRDSLADRLVAAVKMEELAAQIVQQAQP